MTYSLKFGTYTFPVGMYPADNNLPSVAPSSKHPRLDGGRVLPASLAVKQISLKGGVVAGTGQSARTIVDGMKAALFGQQPANFTHQSDRYWRNVYCRDFKDGHPGTHYDRIDDIEADLIAGDPFQYEFASNALAMIPTGTVVSGTATAGGNAYAKPAISFTALSAFFALTLYNDTTAETFTLAGNCAVGDVCVVDCLNETVTIAGVNRMDLFEGLFPRLLVGANVIRSVYSASTLTAIACVWSNRWY